MRRRRRSFRSPGGGGAVIRKFPALRKLLALSCLVALTVLAVDLARPAAETPTAVSERLHHLKQGFRNLEAGYSYGMGERARRLARRVFLEGWPERGPVPAVLHNDGRALRANGDHPTMTWIGHATFLVQLDGVNILTDPNWSDRASPVAFAGPRRLVAPGMRFEDLPPIHAVVISHDHYDHLDIATVRRLAGAHHPTFVVPLGFRAWFADFGIRDVVEVDWWESRTVRGLTITATPAQHSSGRTLLDQNHRLWASWAIAGRNRRMFFAGDTGYCPVFKEIGRRLGPFDAAAIPIGGYSAYEGHHPNHVNPEEAVQVFEDVRAKLLIPMHWGTFDLNREPFQEPPTRLLREARRRGVEERVALLSPGQSIDW